MRNESINETSSSTRLPSARKCISCKTKPVFSRSLCYHCFEIAVQENALGYSVPSELRKIRSFKCTARELERLALYEPRQLFLRRTPTKVDCGYFTRSPKLPEHLVFYPVFSFFPTAGRVSRTSTEDPQYSLSFRRPESPAPATAFASSLLSLKNQLRRYSVFKKAYAGVLMLADLFCYYRETQNRLAFLREPPLDSIRFVRVCDKRRNHAANLGETFRRVYALQSYDRMLLVSLCHSIDMSWFGSYVLLELDGIRTRILQAAINKPSMDLKKDVVDLIRRERVFSKETAPMLYVQTHLRGAKVTAAQVDFLGLHTSIKTRSKATYVITAELARKVLRKDKKIRELLSI